MRCSENGCPKAARSRGLCRTCYGKRWRAGEFGAPRPRCLEPNCNRRAQEAGRCKRCYSRWHRSENPEKYARYNENRRAARCCRDCGQPVAKQAQLCDECRAAKTKAKATDRQKNHDMVRQLERMRRERAGHARRLPRVGTPKQVGEQIGADADDATAVELLRIVAHDPCAYCGGPCEAIDHVEPLARGGDRAIENVTASCDRCNSRKSDRRLLPFLILSRIDEQLEPLATQRRLAVAI